MFFDNVEYSVLNSQGMTGDIDNPYGSNTRNPEPVTKLWTVLQYDQYRTIDAINVKVPRYTGESAYRRGNNFQRFNWTNWRTGESASNVEVDENIGVLTRTNSTSEMAKINNIGVLK